MLRVVRGDPSPEELAALVAVLAARASSAAAGRPEPRAVGGWVDRSAGLRRPIAPGPDAWRTTGREPGTRTIA